MVLVEPLGGTTAVLGRGIARRVSATGKCPLSAGGTASLFTVAGKKAFYR
jgi:hypothetical protein